MTEATCYANTDDGELIKDDVAWAAARDAIVMGAGGLAKLGIMAVDDYNNTAPTGSSMSAHASGDDATYKPYLKVKYGISQLFPTYVQ